MSENSDNDQQVDMWLNQLLERWKEYGEERKRQCEALAANLPGLMGKKGMTPTALAEASGSSLGLILKIATGQCAPTILKVGDLRRALECRASDLLMLPPTSS